MWIRGLLGALCISLALASPEGNRSDVSELIYGGIKQELPFPPLMVIEASHPDFVLICGGTLLNENYVLTAAHCAMFMRPYMDYITVYAGLAHLNDKNLEHPVVQRSKVTSFTAYHNYDLAKFFVNDIAIIKLATPFQYTPKIQPTKIYVTGFDLPTEIPNQSVSIYGFGDQSEKEKTQDNRLYRADTTIVNREECNKMWRNRFPGQRTNFPQITLDLLCTSSNGRGALAGDSGGPVINFEKNPFTQQIEARQIGIISSRGDGKLIPDVHVRTSSYCTWITEVTENTFLCSFVL